LDGTSIRGAKLGRRSNGEGSIAKRKDGRWSAAYTMSGKRKCVYGKTRKEAATKLRDAIAEQDNGNYYPDIRLEDYMGRWLGDSVRGSVRERIYERYEQVSRNHIVPDLGDISLPSLTEMEIQSLYRRKLDSGCSPRTVQMDAKASSYRSATTWNAIQICLSYAGPTVLSWRHSVPGTWTPSKWSRRFGRMQISKRGIFSSLTFESAAHPLPSDRPPALYLLRSPASAANRLCGSLLLGGREGMAQHGGHENPHGDKDDVHRYRHETLPVPALFRYL
jgi:hypothetical protein